MYKIRLIGYNECITRIYSLFILSQLHLTQKNSKRKITSTITCYTFIEQSNHYCDVIMGALSSQITSLTIVYSTVYSGADQRRHHAYIQNDENFV